MPTATPETLVAVLRDVLTRAATDAADQFEHNIARIKQDAEGAWAEIRDEVTHPRWQDYLLYLLVRIRDLDPQHITVGTGQTDRGELVTLGYVPVPPNTAAVVLGLGRDGVLLEVTGTGSTSLAAGGLRVSIEAAGTDGVAASWWFPFGHAPELPAQAAKLDVTASWALAKGVDTDAVKVKLGPVYVHGHLETAGTPGYELLVGLGDGKTNGVAVDVDFGQQLGVVGDVVSVAPLRDGYSPNVRIASGGAAPTFSLSQRGPTVKGA